MLLCNSVKHVFGVSTVLACRNKFTLLHLYTIQSRLRIWHSLLNLPASTVLSCFNLFTNITGTVHNMLYIYVCMKANSHNYFTAGVVDTVYMNSCGIFLISLGVGVT